MVRRSGLWSLAVCAAVIGFSAEPATAAEVFLGITRSEAAAIPASVVRVTAPGAMAGKVSEVKAVLEADLRRSLVFRMIDPPPLSDLLAADSPDAGLITKIGKRGIEAVIWVGLESDGKDVILEGQVFDGGTAVLVFGKRYLGDARVLRAIIHRFADEMVFRYTGERGIAETRIAYVSKVTGSKEIYVMDYDGFNPRRVTSDRSLALSPEWSPDGKWISYTSYRDGNPNIYTLELQTGRRWKMVGFPGLNISPTWSPQGDRFLFSSAKAGTMQLYSMNRDRSGLRKLTGGLADNLSPSLSPTGAEMAFVSNRGGRPQIYLASTDGTNPRRLTFKGTYNTSPAWSPKGDWIAYTCQVEGLMRICLITPDGSTQFQLTDGRGEQEDPSWSPDGRHLVFRSTRDSSGGDLYRMSVEREDLERLTFNGAQNGSPAWSPLFNQN
jgi:TolB protein